MHAFICKLNKELCIGCSGKIVFFLQEFVKFCHLSLASTGLLLVVQKIEWLYTHNMLRTLKITLKGWVAVDYEKHILYWTAFVLTRLCEGPEAEDVRM